MSRQNLSYAPVIFVAIAALAMPHRIHAQFTGKASATGQFESNSNVFNLESGFPQPGTEDFQRSDSFYAYGAEFDAKYLSGPQEFYATANTYEYDYQRFTELDHNDYKIDAGLNWKLGDISDGKIDIARTHVMVPFVDLTEQTLSLSLQTEQRETVSAGIKVTPDWRIEGSGFTRKVDEPEPGAPSLELTESSGSAAINYLGVAGLTSGFTAGYLTGAYQATNGIENPNYHQVNAGLTVNYKSGHSLLDGQVGYSSRDSATSADSVSGLTGQIKVQDQLTPKTSVHVMISRLINSYVSNAGSEIDSLAGLGATWQATFKLAVTAGYTFTYRDYPGQGNNPPGSNRIDHQQYASLELNYQPQRWLVIRPYANVLRRGSNYIGGDFNATIFGVSLVFQTPEKHY